MQNLRDKPTRRIIWAKSSYSSPDAELAAALAPTLFALVTPAEPEAMLVPLPSPESSIVHLGSIDLQPLSTEEWESEPTRVWSRSRDRRGGVAKALAEASSLRGYGFDPASLPALRDELLPAKEDLAPTELDLELPETAGERGPQGGESMTWRGFAAVVIAATALFTIFAFGPF